MKGSQTMIWKAEARGENPQWVENFLDHFYTEQRIVDKNGVAYTRKVFTGSREELQEYVKDNFLHPDMALPTLEMDVSLIPPGQRRLYVKFINGIRIQIRTQTRNLLKLFHKR